MAIRQETARGGTGWLQRFGFRPYWIIVAAGLALRLFIAPRGGHAGDLATLSGWASTLGVHGLPAIYLASDANYPPLALTFLAVSQGIYRLLGGVELAGPLWWTLLKLPAILADTVIVLLAGQLAPCRHRLAWLTAGIVFNPAMIYLSAWWGQIESLYMLGALAALMAATARRPLLAGVMLGLGVMVKLQAAVVTPLVVLVVLMETGRARSLVQLIVGFFLPVIPALGPYIWIGQGELVSRRLVALVAGPGWLTVNALNPWYLLTGGAGNWAYNKPFTWPDSTPVVAGISARAIGTSMLVVWTAAVLAFAWRRMALLALRLSENKDAERARTITVLEAGAMLYLGVFLWPTQAHERYVFGAVVLLAGAALVSQAAIYEDKWLTALYIAITLACMLNLVWAAPFAPWLEGWFAGERIAGSLIALLFITAAAYGLWLTADGVQPRANSQ